MKSYEFSINAEAKVRVVIDELVSIIRTREQIKWSDDNVEKLILCDSNRGCILPKERSFYQSQVKAGSCLILL